MSYAVSLASLPLFFPESSLSLSGSSTYSLLPRYSSFSFSLNQSEGSLGRDLSEVYKKIIPHHFSNIIFDCAGACTSVVRLLVESSF